MRTRTRALVMGVSLAGTLLVVPASATGASQSSGGGGARAHTTTLRFHVEFSPFDYTDLGSPGPSAADVIVFHDKLFMRGQQVGDEVGTCTVVEASGLSSCTAVMQLDGRGTIAFALVNSPPPHKVLAVTGGSGEFRTVRGDGTLDEHGDGTGDLVLRLTR
jgi:hypothetical protein